jgi:hypothetical protein
LARAGEDLDHGRLQLVGSAPAETRRPPARDEQVGPEGRATAAAIELDQADPGQVALDEHDGDVVAARWCVVARVDPDIERLGGVGLCRVVEIGYAADHGGVRRRVTVGVEEAVGRGHDHTRGNRRSAT